LEFFTLINKNEMHPLAPYTLKAGNFSKPAPVIEGLVWVVLRYDLPDPVGQGAEALLTYRNRTRYRHLGEKHTRLTRINTWPTPVKSVNLNREPLNP